MVYYNEYVSPIGILTLKSDGEALTGLLFHQCTDVEMTSLPLFDCVKQWLDDYFDSKQPSLSFPIHFEGTTFRQNVWNQLLKIPYGKTMSYKEIAEIIGRQMNKKPCAQAVGQAVGANPIGIVVPCHRVLGSDLSLTGFSGGIEKKIYLLEIENISYRERQS